ncbi:Uu.00g117430.m01.CDS01 [Anthostomella pinea]|uniref:Uu.00g117430.m01.CDS01 n=1 Tax=Anthostomella pinea TaxID=933095 RepID=A0AAI8YGX5_9PEZI|nr:Uu.00g117430.m01.CDS01 [Anthostomella pinea]
MAEKQDVESGRSKGFSHFQLVFDQARVTPEVEKWNYEGSGTEDDPYVVDWIDNDPGNPMLFADSKKWFLTMLVAIATLAVAFVSSAYSGGIEQIIVEFGIGQEVATLGLSLFVLGFAIGPLMWAPMSELYGRQLLFFGTYAALTAFNAGAAGAQNSWTLIILRFFAGAFGSSPLTNAGGVIADMFPAKQRGLAMALFAAAPFLGPTLGPLIGGFLGMTEGWRWVEGLMAIFTGALWLIGGLLIPETYPPVLLRKRAAKLSKMTGKVYKSRAEVDQGPTTAGTAFKTALTRPWILLFREPIVFLLSIYMAIIYGTLYMLFGAFPIVYQQNRGWNEGVGGLAFMGVLVGMLIAVLYVIVYENKRYSRAADKAGGFAAPEQRLYMTMVGSACVPLGMIWFAWTNYPDIHFMASITAGVPFGFGMVCVFLGVMNYLIDAYVIFAASVLAANSVLRSLFGAAFPLFTTQMYGNLGIHWASMVPAFLALVCVPFPFLFFKYGPQIRARCKFAAEADAFMKKMQARQQGGAANDEQWKDAEEGDQEVDHRAEEKEAERDLAEEDTQSTSSRPLYAEINTSNGGGAQRNNLSRTGTNQTGRSVKSTRSIRHQPYYDDNPYDIDRVNTKESFTPRSRANTIRSQK